MKDMNEQEREGKTPADLVHGDLSYAIIGCGQRVHTRLGPGFPEKVYHRALCHELALRHVPFQSQAEFEVTYEGCLCGTFKVDILVQGKVVVELKAVDGFCTQHEAQVLAYLKASGKAVALLFNFGEPKLTFRRFVN